MRVRLSFFGSHVVGEHVGQRSKLVTADMYTHAIGDLQTPVQTTIHEKVRLAG